MLLPLLLTALAVLASGLPAVSQAISNAGPAPATTVLEVFSGVRCAPCPAAHLLMESLEARSGNNELLVLAYHPANSNCTTPVHGAPNFRRTFANDFYTSGFASAYSAHRYMPSAMINRQLLPNGDRLLPPDAWSEALEARTTASNAPMNVGLCSSYDSATNALTVEVELRYLETVASSNRLYVMLAERGLSTSYQAGSSGRTAYTFQHLVFRESLTSEQWGDPVGNTAQNAINHYLYTYYPAAGNSASNLKQTSAIALVSNSATGELFTGVAALAMKECQSTGSTPPPMRAESATPLSVWPNPASTRIHVQASTELPAAISLCDVTGRPILHLATDGAAPVELNIEHLAAGLYLIILEQQGLRTVQQLVVQ